MAISSYLLGLLGYAAKGLEGLGLALDPGPLAALGVTVVVPVVWGGVGTCGTPRPRRPRGSRGQGPAACSRGWPAGPPAGRRRGSPRAWSPDPRLKPELR